MQGQVTKMKTKLSDLGLLVLPVSAVTALRVDPVAFNPPKLASLSRI